MLCLTKVVLLTLGQVVCIVLTAVAMAEARNDDTAAGLARPLYPLPPLYDVKVTIIVIRVNRKKCPTTTPLKGPRPDHPRNRVSPPTVKNII